MRRLAAAVLFLSLFVSGCGPTYLDLIRQQYRQSMARAATPQQKAEIQRDYEIQLREYEIQLLEENNRLLRERQLFECSPYRILCR